MKNAAIENFFLDEILIKPIEDICEKLKKSEFRDIDIKWLNAQLDKFAGLAAKTFGIELDQELIYRPQETLNDFVAQDYLNKFNILLKYFKDLVAND